MSEIDQLIERLGGYRRLAHLTKTGVPAVYHWAARGIPRRHHRIIRRLANETGIQLDDSLFEYATHEEKENEYRP